MIKEEIRDFMFNESKIVSLFEKTFLPTIVKNHYKDIKLQEKPKYFDIYLSKEPYKNFLGAYSLVSYVQKNMENPKLNTEDVIKNIINERYSYYKKEFELGNFKEYVTYTLSYDIKNNTPSDIKNDNKLIFQTKKEIRELKEDVSKSSLISKEEYNILTKENVRSINKNLEKNVVTKNYKLNKYYKISPNVSNEYEKKFMEEFDASFKNLPFYVKTNDKSEIKDDLMCNVSIVVMENGKDTGMEINDKDILLKDINIFENTKIKLSQELNLF